MWGFISIFRDYKRAVLALMALSVAALYGAAVAYPVDRPERAVRAWVALPQVTPEFEVLPPDVPVAPQLEVTSVNDLHHALEALGFGLKPVRRGNVRVPRLFVGNLPADFDATMVVAERKQAFIRMVLPLILKANEDVLTERRRLIDLEGRVSSGLEISESAHAWLEALAEKYRAAPNDFVTLLRRVDAVSPTLALAQSIEESGWGRSRFASEGNALYGQRVWSQGGGFVPAERGESETFEVRAFGSLLESVQSYVVNLNRHYAYEDYRAMRALMRAHDTELDGLRLATTLANYSERRGAYVDALSGLIVSNRLDQFEDVQLSNAPIDPADTRLAAR